MTAQPDEQPAELVRLPEHGLGGRRKRRPERHDDILVTSARLFHEHGYHATSLEMIAAASDITGPAIYRHFRSKQEILDTAATWITDLITSITDTALTAPGTAKVRLRVVIEGLIGASLDYQDFVAIFRQDMGMLSDPVRSRCIEQRGRLLAELAVLIRAVQPKLTPAEARLAVRLTFAVVSASTTRDGVSRDEALTLARSMAFGALQPSALAARR